ncbi:efflux RND transporter periplasmic adaptor subunit [Cognatilysobacter tabacisoli]|uniref:efflux RND transporter periplasmic adaptor subunit n=1 Tax=Cognatilysobacter tabacisoli TaxID=2315424 RepID=UPI001E419D31|nr:efflux RND transporter periplasmic adaptor subunit [Lysobacter tabacisoli]
MAATILASDAPRAHAPVRFLALVLACALLAACGGDEPAADGDAAAAVSAMAVTTVRAQTREVARTITVSGPVAAVEEMQLGVELSGQRVTSLDVDVGETVRRGQVLLTLDHRLLDADLAQANAALREAEASAALARSNLARAERLAQGQFVSASQVDELRAARTQADARVGTARASRDAVALRRSFAELRAPADGIISRRLVQPGQVVAAGSELLRLIKDGRLEWRAELAAEQLAAVSPGDVIALTARDGTTVDGRVRAVTPGVDSATRTGTVYADLPQPGALQPGTYLEGRISTGRGPATVLPAAAVVLRDGFATVFTVEANNTVKQRRIVAGSRDGDQVVVASGLPAGARVVVDGAGFLADGDAVRVVEATAATPARPAADAAPAR